LTASKLLVFGSVHSLAAANAIFLFKWK